MHTLVFPPSHRPELETLQDLSRNRAVRCIYFARSKVNWNDDDSDLEDTANESDYVVDEEIVDDPRLSSICQYDTPGYVAKHTATCILKRLVQRKTVTKIE